MDVRIQRYDILSTDAQALIALNSELASVYPEDGAAHFRLDPSEVAEGSGAFLVAFRAGAAVGCGAICRIDALTGELKRMYGVRQARALSSYERDGFAPIPPFGEYVGSPLSVCMAKDL